MSQRIAQLLLVVVAATLSGCASLAPRSRQAALTHFFQVDEHLYRGGQPSAEGFRQLAAMGIKTVVSLRAQSEGAREEERRLVESLGMRWVSLPMRMYWRPTDAQVRTFLAMVSDPSRQPVFVHCQHGEDRTGSLVAVYRVVRAGWAPALAYDEARALGLAGWNPFMRTLILREARQKFASL